MERCAEWRAQPIGSESSSDIESQPELAEGLGAVAQSCDSVVTSSSIEASLPSFCLCLSICSYFIKNMLRRFCWIFWRSSSELGTCCGLADKY